MNSSSRHTMVSYCNDDLQQVQQYRAVIETHPHSSNPSIEQTITKQPKHTINKIINTLDPTSESKPTSDTVKNIVADLSQNHKQVATARLERVANQNNVSPFRKATVTESMYNMSKLTRSNAPTVNDATVGIMYQGLTTMIEEIGGNPEQMLPDSMLNRPIATKDGEPLAPSGTQPLEDYYQHGTMEDQESANNTSTRHVKQSNRLTAKDLMDKHGHAVDKVRSRIKYERDCFFLRELYDPITNLLDDPKCPKLVWKQAALDIKSNDDPFSNLDSNDDDDITTNTDKPSVPEILMDIDVLNEDQSNGEDNDNHDGSAQAGLGQF